MLHLLKQPSEEHKETFAAQARDQVGRPELHPWWEEVALRSAAVLCPEVDWKQAKGDVPMLKRALQSSAIVNIYKKHAKQTKDKDVRRWAKEYSGLDGQGWEKQIEDYRPADNKRYVILCGGLTTFWAAYDALRAGQMKDSKRLERCVRRREALHWRRIGSASAGNEPDCGDRLTRGELCRTTAQIEN